jgi:hypothetical protein
MGVPENGTENWNSQPSITGQSKYLGLKDISNKEALLRNIFIGGDKVR